MEDRHGELKDHATKLHERMRDEHRTELEALEPTREAFAGCSETAPYGMLSANRY